MKILVPIKRVIDYQVKVRLKPDKSTVETTNVKMSLNPFDEIAVEEAVRIKEQGVADSVVAVSIGPAECEETLRNALAIGADEALRVDINDALEPLAIAKCLKAVVTEQQCDFVIMGKQAIDDDCNQTGQMLAGLLGWSQGTFASKLEFDKDTVTVTREVDAGLETLRLKLPAVITTDLRLNEPRFISLPNIMQAKSKPLTVKSINDYGVEPKQHVEVQSYALPSTREAGIKVESVVELMQKLKDEAKVL